MRAQPGEQGCPHGSDAVSTRATTKIRERTRSGRRTKLPAHQILAAMPARRLALRISIHHAR